jgi:hypothetical protein
VTWSATNPETQSALEIHGQAIATEVLATSWVSGLVHVETVSDQELGFSCNLTKAN